MLIVDALTNNVNRTASDVRAAFGKNGGRWAYLDQLLACLIMWQHLVLKQVVEPSNSKDYGTRCRRK